MRAFLFIILLSFATFSSIAQKVSRDESIAQKGLTYDFGDVPDNVGKVRHTFFLANTGNHEVRVCRADASCSCTTASYGKGVIRPGCKLAVEVSFDPIGLRGHFSRRIIVRTDSLRKYVCLRIEGNVIAPKF